MRPVDTKHAKKKALLREPFPSSMQTSFRPSSRVGMPMFVVAGLILRGVLVGDSRPGDFRFDDSVLKRGDVSLRTPLGGHTWMVFFDPLR